MRAMSLCQVSTSVAAFTVRRAASLATFPAELLTMTLNCDPLSCIVAAGVV